MDVSQLSVTIDVDISAFIDAMDQVGAMMLAVAAEFEDAADRISTAFEGINKSGEENKGFWTEFGETFLKIIDIASKVKDTIEVLGWIFSGLGVAFEAVSAEGLIGALDGVLVAAEALSGPIGWTILAVTALGTALYAYFHSSSYASDSVEKVNEDTKQLADTMLFAEKNGDALHKKLESISSITSYKFDGYKELLNGNKASSSEDDAEASSTDSGVDLKSLNAQLAKAREKSGINAATVKLGSDNDSSKQESLFNSFISKYQAYYEKLKELLPPSKGHIKITETVTLKGPDASSDRKPGTDFLAPKSGDEMLQKPEEGLGDMSIKVVPGIQASARAVAEYNERMKESAELQKEVQDSAVSAFSAIGQALGQMIAGQKAINPLAALMKQMGDSLKKYGEFLITAGTAMLFGGDPYGAAKVGEGIALEAVGTAMGAVKMAQGGIVSGSTFANIGEYAGASHNPEVVAPLDKLRSMMGGSNGNTHYSFEIMGDKMVTAMQRQSNNNNFVLGTNNQ